MVVGFSFVGSSVPSCHMKLSCSRIGGQTGGAWKGAGQDPAHLCSTAGGKSVHQLCFTCKLANNDNAMQNTCSAHVMLRAM